MRLHYRECGQGQPLVILHGLFGSLGNWSGVSRRLADQFHVYAVDQRNHGASPHSPEMDFPLMAEDLLEFFREHSISSAAVMGHSMGGKTAMQFALSWPRRVDKLVVVDIAPRRYAPAHEGILTALLAAESRLAQTRKEMDGILAQDIPDPVVRRFLLNNLARGADGRFRWNVNVDSIAQNHLALHAPISGPGTFSAPVLFVAGGKSDYITPQDHENIRRAFPAAEIAIIPSAGHWVHADAPEPFVETVRRFLAK